MRAGGAALFDLVQLLHSRTGQEKLTIQEANILMSWRAQALRDFIIGFGGGNVVSILATGTPNNLLRMGLSAGLATIFGFWNCKRSIDSCIEHALSLEGSRIQRELANIMLTKYSNDPWVLQRISKHFYPEEVYDDSTEDKPKFRWHFRNTYGDPRFSFSECIPWRDKNYSRKKDVDKTMTKAEEVYVNTAADASHNPFDFIFGFPERAENTPSPDASSTSSRMPSLRERRSRRRHRRRHQDDSEA